MNETLNMVAAWVQTYPHWGDGPLQVDMTPPEPGCCGLFPVGEEELHRTEDVLGTVTCHYRQEFLLRRVTLRGENAAAWLLNFGRWVKTTQPPALGDNCVARALRGRLLTSVQTGLATYEIKISMEYSEELNYGKN